MADWIHTKPKELIQSFLSSGAESTGVSYASDLRMFRDFLGVKTEATAVRKFLDLSRGAARRTLDDFRNHLRSDGLALATVRRRLFCILSIARLAHEYDIVTWAIRMKLPPAPPARNVQGPKREEVLRMICFAEDRRDAKGLRDAAILHLLFYSALRSREVLLLDLEHVNLDRCEVEVLGKGKWERAGWPMALITKQAIEQWLIVRGEEPGPLFQSFNHSAKGMQRLSRRGLWCIVSDIGRRVGVRCWPHGLRHTGITEAASLTGGNVRFMLALSRHCDPKTTIQYDDGARRLARQAVELVAGGVANYRC